MSKMANIRIVDELLSSVAQGYSNEEFVADKLFPEVAVRREAGKIRHFTKDLFNYHSANRAVGGNSNVIQPGTETPISWSLDEFDLALPVDYREEAEADDISIERSRTYELTEMMKLRREKTIADAVQTIASYTNSNTSAVVTKWDAANSNPLTDMLGAADVVRGNIGRRPNTLLLGYASWRTVQMHDEVLAVMKTTDTKILTPQLLGQILEIPNVIIGKAIWRNPATGVDANVWLDNAILAYVPGGNFDQRSIRTPGFGYTLVKRGWPPVDTYMAEGNKVKYIRYTALETALFHGNIAGYLLSDTNT